MALVAIADQTLTWEDSSGFLQGVTTASFGGTPSEKPDLYRRASPITYAEDVRAPLLVIQGRHDTRCPPRQMEVYEARMKALGKDIEVSGSTPGTAPARPKNRLAGATECCASPGASSAQPIRKKHPCLALLANP